MTLHRNRPWAPEPKFAVVPVSPKDYENFPLNGPNNEMLTVLVAPKIFYYEVRCPGLEGWTRTYALSRNWPESSRPFDQKQLDNKEHHAYRIIVLDLAKFNYLQQIGFLQSEVHRGPRTERVIDGRSAPG